jgi:hypothetical protein
MARQKRMKKQNFISRYQFQVIALIILCITVLCKYIFLGKKIGSMGMGVYTTVFSFLFMIVLLLAWILREIVEKAVFYRKSRNQYRNAIRITKAGALAGLCIGVVLFAVFVLAAGKLTNSLFRMGAYGTFSMMITAGAFPWIFLSSALSGGFSGFDFEIPDGASKLVFGISDMLFSILFVAVACKMGVTHGNLLHDENIVGAFGAAGAAAGFTGACILAAIWQLALFRAFRRKMKGKIAEDMTRNQESLAEQLTGLFSACGIPFLRFFLLYGANLVPMLLFFVFYRKTELPFIQYGSGYAASFLWFLLPIGLTLLFGKYSEDLLQKVMKEADIYHCGMRIVFGMKQYLCFLLPIIAVFGVCLKAMQEAAFGDTDTYALLITVEIAIWSLVALEMSFLKGIGKEKLGIGSGLAAFLIQVAASFLLLSKECDTAKDILYCNLVFVVVFMMVCSALLARFCVYKKQLTRHLLMPAVAVFTAVITAVLCMFLKTVIGNVLTIILTCLVSFVVHSLTLLVTGCIREGEANGFPQGDFLLLLGRLLGIYS